MPLTRQQKESLVEQYEQGLAGAANVFLVNYKGVSVPQVTDLRNQVRDVGASYMVVKNRLVLRTIEEGALGQLKEHFSGPVAVAFGEGDPVGLAKVLSEFAKSVEAFELKAGLVDGQPVAAEQITEIANLPSREELMAKLVFMLASPMTRLVRTLGAIPRNFVVVLNQIRAKKQEQEGS